MNKTDYVSVWGMMAYALSANVAALVALYQENLRLCVQMFFVSLCMLLLLRLHFEAMMPYWKREHTDTPPEGE